MHSCGLAICYCGDERMGNFDIENLSFPSMYDFFLPSNTVLFDKNSRIITVYLEPREVDIHFRHSVAYSEADVTTHTLPFPELLLSVQFSTEQMKNTIMFYPQRVAMNTFEGLPLSLDTMVGPLPLPNTYPQGNLCFGLADNYFPDLPSLMNGVYRHYFESTFNLDMDVDTMLMTNPFMSKKSIDYVQQAIHEYDPDNGDEHSRDEFEFTLSDFVISTFQRWQEKGREVGWVHTTPFSSVLGHIGYRTQDRDGPIYSHRLARDLQHSFLTASVRGD